MKNILLSVISAALFMTATTACADSFRTENTLIIKGPIAGETMQPIAEKMTELLMRDRPPSHISIVIDSPGGSVYAGFRFLAQMKSLQGKGTRIDCYVPGLAASMAFHILTHCDRRVVLEESALLWHRARIFVMFGTLTAPASSAVARDLQSIDDHILNDVRSVLKKDMSDADISYHFEHETLHIGQRLCNSAPNFCTSTAHVPGLMEIMNDLAVTTTQPVEEAEGKKKKNMFTGIESVVYIYEEFLNKLVGDN